MNITHVHNLRVEHSDAPTQDEYNCKLLGIQSAGTPDTHTDYCFVAETQYETVTRTNGESVEESVQEVGVLPVPAWRLPGCEPSPPLSPIRLMLGSCRFSTIMTCVCCGAARASESRKAGGVGMPATPQQPSLSCCCF
jgi:hypothetical protein